MIPLLKALCCIHRPARVGGEIGDQGDGGKKSITSDEPPVQVQATLLSLKLGKALFFTLVTNF